MCVYPSTCLVIRSCSSSSSISSSPRLPVCGFRSSSSSYFPSCLQSHRSQHKSTHYVVLYLSVCVSLFVCKSVDETKIRTCVSLLLCFTRSMFYTVMLVAVRMVSVASVLGPRIRLSPLTPSPVSFYLRQTLLYPSPSIWVELNALKTQNAQNAMYKLIDKPHPTDQLIRRPPNGRRRASRARRRRAGSGPPSTERPPSPTSAAAAAGPARAS